MGGKDRDSDRDREREEGGRIPARETLRFRNFLYK